MLGDAYRRMVVDKVNDAIKRDDGRGRLRSLGQQPCGARGRLPARKNSHGCSTGVLCSKQTASQRRHWGRGHEKRRD